MTAAQRKNRSDFVAMVGSFAAAMRLETTILSVGDEFLPANARVVRDGGDPDDGYYDWLCSQVEHVVEGT